MWPIYRKTFVLNTVPKEPKYLVHLSRMPHCTMRIVCCSTFWPTSLCKFLLTVTSLLFPSCEKACPRNRCPLRCPCQNGGICQGKCVCACPPGWTVRFNVLQMLGWAPILTKFLMCSKFENFGPEVECVVFIWSRSQGVQCTDVSQSTEWVSVSARHPPIFGKVFWEHPSGW